MTAVAIMAGTAVLMIMVGAALPGARSVALFSPIGLFIGYLAIATGAVPVLWLLGWARPWSEIAQGPYTAALAAVVALIATASGVIAARPVPVARRIRLETPQGNLDRALLAGFAIGVGGYLLLAVSAGGPIALLYSLADRRDLLAGTGPLRAVMGASAVACVYGVLHVTKTPRQRVLTWACGLSYVGMTLLTGSRFQAIVLVVAATCAYVWVHGWSWRLRTLLLVAALAAVPLSTVYGAQVRTGLTYGQEVPLADSTTGGLTVEAVVGPFVRGGLDTIRTTGVAMTEQPPLRFNVDLLVGSLANVVPRSLWPNKPEGAATQFSRDYFPSKWAEGTGIPPSIFAEMVHSFGSIGGLVSLLLLAVLLTRLSYWMMARPRPFWLLLSPFFAADCVQLAKGGSDGFLRTLILQIGAVLVIVLIARTARTTVHIDRADGPETTVQRGRTAEPARVAPPSPGGAAAPAVSRRPGHGP